jgi:hypothetical protein
MEQVIVTIKRADEVRARDIELAVDVPIRELLTTLAEALGWNHDASGQPLDYIAEAHPPGRFLRSDETLAQAQIWDGTWLVLHPQPIAAGTQVLSNHAKNPSAASSADPVATPPTAGPVSGWQPLTSQSGPHVQSAQASPTEPPPDPGSGYVWKRVDED